MTEAQCKAARERLGWCLQRPASPEAAEELAAQLAAVDMLEKVMEFLEKARSSTRCECARSQSDSQQLLREWRGEGERG